MDNVDEPALERLLRERLARVEERLAAACARAGRARRDVTLVAVTKTVPAQIARHLLALGVHDLGENRPQELWRKAEQIAGPVRWHLIGHLQRNKIEKTLPLVQLIHSVDSRRLLSALEAEAERQQCSVGVFLEVNASGEESKQGFAPAEVPPLVPFLTELRQVQVRGLMTMAAPGEPETARTAFATLRQLCERLRTEMPSVECLSMGMSNDFEIAVEEGATHVRLGSVLFEGLA
jgi:pyridoxal phosphate enzyme (YggS family)